MKRTLGPAFFAALLILSSTLVEAQAAWNPGQRSVTVNGERISAQDLRIMDGLLGSPVRDGNYWYDQISGLVGFIGQPTLGQFYPGLPIGGRLRSDCSGPGTGVYLNGRNIPGAEARYLAQILQTPVQPGRYWLDAYGNAGYEGGPALVNLIAAARQNQPSGSVHTSEGSVTVGGGIVGFTPSSTGIISTPGVTCGPDGGCIYSK